MRDDIEDSPHDEEGDGSVGCFENILGVIVSFVVLVGLLYLSQQLVPVLQAELLSAELLPAIKLCQGLLYYRGVLNVEHLVVNVRPEV